MKESMALTKPEELLYRRLTTKEPAAEPAASFLKEFEASSISSMRIFRAMMEDVFPLVSVTGFSMEEADKLYTAGKRYYSYTGHGFIPIGKRNDLWLPCALVPLWIMLCFEYKSYGPVKDLASSTRGLLTNEREFQCALSDVCFNVLFGPLGRKAKKIEEMYRKEYGALFRMRTDAIPAEKEFDLLMESAKIVGFRYCGR